MGCVNICNVCTASLQHGDSYDEYTCSSLCICSPVLVMRACCLETLSSMSAKTRRVESRLFLVMKARLLNLPIKAWMASTLALLFWTRLEMLWRWQKKRSNNYRQ